MSESPAKIINSAVSRIVSAISQEVFGHVESAKSLVGAFIIGGHVLLEGPPGIAKTLLARSFASKMGLRFNRIQFTPDLMPSDVTGVYIFDQQTASFRLAAGPVFADILLADEINRTPPKTQSALLEAMQEKYVTIDGKRHPLGEFFFVVATQNPIEHEGTYPLPEAQLDRFLFKIKMNYPGKDFETSMIQELSSLPAHLWQDARSLAEEHLHSAIIGAEELSAARDALREIRLEPTITDYVFRIIQATREHGDLLLGASPRAALYLALASKFQAALEERDYVIPDDVKLVCPLVLAHRLVFKPEFLEAQDSAQQLLTEILARVAVPSQ